MEGSAFTVLPMSQRVSLAAGETYSGSITVVNPNDATEDFSYKIEVLPYNVVGEDYSADLATVSDRSAMVNWIKVPESTGTVKPNESKKVEFEINVPENAPAGGQYAAIAVSSNEAAQGSGSIAVNNVFELASIVYAEVAGETVRGGEIVDNNLPGFVVQPPVVASATISNEGNVHADATFIIKVTNAITGESILPTEDNDGQYNELIMPETTRNVTREINDLPALGVIKVSQTIYYNGDVNIVEKNVVICPIWFMALLAVTLCAIVLAIIKIVTRGKRKKAVI